MGSFQYPYNAPSFTFLHCFLTEKKKERKRAAANTEVGSFYKAKNYHLCCGTSIWGIVLHLSEKICLLYYEK